jgi:hypothetical protein
MKKILASIGILVAAALILGGCAPANAKSAGAAAESTAGKAEAAVMKLETLTTEDFAFPAVLGTDFFVADGANTDEANADGASMDGTSTNGADINSADMLTGDVRTSGTDNTEAPAKFPEGNGTNFTHSGYANARRVQSGNTAKYKSRHFDVQTLNHAGAARTTFYDRLDDLYVLCADISAANEKCKEVAEEIKIESAQLRQLAAELKSGNQSGKGVFEQFNRLNAEMGDAVAALYKDRGAIQNKLRAIPKNQGSSIDVESETQRYLMIMNKVEARLAMLQNAHNKIKELNANIRAILGNDMRSNPGTARISDGPAADISVMKESAPVPQPAPEKAEQIARRRITRNKTAGTTDIGTTNTGSGSTIGSGSSNTGNGSNTGSGSSSNNTGNGSNTGSGNTGSGRNTGSGSSSTNTGNISRTRNYSSNINNVANMKNSVIAPKKMAVTNTTNTNTAGTAVPAVPALPSYSAVNTESTANLENMENKTNAENMANHIVNTANTVNTADSDNEADPAPQANRYRFNKLPPQFNPEFPKAGEEPMN